MEIVNPDGFLIANYNKRKWRIILPAPIRQALWLYRFFILWLSEVNSFYVVRNLTKFWFQVYWWFIDSWNRFQILRRLSRFILHYTELAIHHKTIYYNYSLLDTFETATDLYRHYYSVTQIWKLLDSLAATEIVVSQLGNAGEIFCKKLGVQHFLVIIMHSFAH